MLLKISGNSVAIGAKNKLNMLKNCYRQYELFTKIRTMMKKTTFTFECDLPGRKSLIYQPQKGRWKQKMVGFC